MRRARKSSKKSNMKLIITGATGFVATEVLRQALLLPSITSVVAVARKPVSPPDGIPSTNASKLKSVVVPDYGTYPEDIRKELAGADACIWYVKSQLHGTPAR
jgi:uncharacterized protein YbjT (DUF2867 family)